MTTHVCPVCGYDGLPDPAWASWGPSHEICPQCNTQFGYDDAIGLEDRDLLTSRHQELHDKWVADGPKPAPVSRLTKPLPQQGSTDPVRTLGDARLNSENHLLINRFFHSPSSAPIVPADPSSIGYMASGGHPDIGVRIAELGSALPAGSTGYVSGRLCLIHPNSLAIIATLAGTGYFLRLTETDFTDAVNQGAKTVKQWNTSTTDLAQEAGPTWIVGTWNATEVSWLQATWASLDTPDSL